MREFAGRLVAWQHRHGRHGLPWQATRDPYRIWLSEVMLQQTQVAAVIPYYERFLARFPDVYALAAADAGEVLRLWSGLGYYARARHLHAAAKLVSAAGAFPHSVQALSELPGIGRSTAAAIAAFAFGRRAAILDGNVKRVLARCFGVVGWPGERAVEAKLWALAEALLPRKDIERYTQALMDLGATVCVRSKPRCAHCPVAVQCVAYRQGSVDAIPAARPRRALPERSVTWLVMRSRGETLLERRPPSGLWGGLWSFPESGSIRVREYCARVLGCEVLATQRLATIEHGFTHFRLHARPLLCEVGKRAPHAESGGRLWLACAEAARAAVPAPVKKLLEQLGAQKLAQPL